MVDLSVHVGDMVKAILNGASSRPLMCVGLCETANAMEFAKAEVVHLIKTRLLTDENFNIPGFIIPPKDAPVDDIEVQTPTLAALLWNGQNIAIKDSDRGKYDDHDAFRARFNELEGAMQQAGKGIKREATNCGDWQPSPKKLKFNEPDNMAQSEPLEFIDPASITTRALA